MRDAVLVSNDSPVLLDHFLNAAIEVDIDAVCDGKHAVIGAIMQHIEQAGGALWRFRLFSAALQSATSGAETKCGTWSKNGLGTGGGRSDELPVGLSGWRGLCDRSESSCLQNRSFCFPNPLESL